MSKKSQVQNIINVVLVALALLMPLFFLPITSEFFEFNKLALLAATTAIMLALWGIHVFITRKLTIAKSSSDIAMLGFLGIVFLSTLFSANKIVSVYGSYGRWFPSLWGVGVLVTFYYVTASNLKSKGLIKKVLLAFTAGATINSLVTLLSYYGVYIGKQTYLSNANFTPTGSITTTAILACTAFLLALNMYVTEKNLAGRIALGISTAVNLFLIYLANIPPIWILLGLGFVLTVLLTPKEKIKEEKIALLALKGTLVVMFVLLVLPVTKKVLVNGNYAKEVTLPIKESWIVASSTIRDFPLLGTGTSTFYLNYPKYKPLNVNTTNYWNNRFDKPANEVFNIVGTLGILGIVIAIYAGIQIAKTVWKSKKVNELSPALVVGVFILLGTSLITYSTILTAFSLLLLLGLTVANQNLSLRKSGNNSGYLTISAQSAVNTIGSIDTDHSILRIVTVAPLIALSALGFFCLYKMYPSEYYMRKAAQAAVNNRGSLTYQYQAKAINNSPRRDVYHNAYAQTSLALAKALATKGEQATNAERETIKTLLSQAVRSSKISTEVLNPASPAGWEIKSNIYKALIGGTENADQWAIDSLNTAIRLDPTNPRLRLDLGGIYYAKQEYLSAANLFRQAAKLKPDYANAYYNFAQAMMFLEDYNTAQRALETVKALVPENTPDYELVANELAKIADLPSVAGAQSTKPTVEEITGIDTTTETTQQESLINKGEETITESTQSEVITE